MPQVLKPRHLSLTFSMPSIRIHIHIHRPIHIHMQHMHKHISMYRYRYIPYIYIYVTRTRQNTPGRHEPNDPKPDSPVNRVQRVPPVACRAILLSPTKSKGLLSVICRSSMASSLQTPILRPESFRKPVPPASSWWEVSAEGRGSDQHTKLPVSMKPQALRVRAL